MATKNSDKITLANLVSIIGIVLMIALFVGFSFYQSHEMEEQQQIVREKAKTEQAERAMSNQG